MYDAADREVVHVLRRLEPVFLEGSAEGFSPGPGRPGDHHQGRAMPRAGRARGVGEIAADPVRVASLDRSPDCVQVVLEDLEDQAPARDLVSVHEHETARDRHVVGAVESDRATALQDALADAVARKHRSLSPAREVGGVDRLLDREHFDHDLGRGHLELVTATPLEGLARHPEDTGANSRGRRGHVVHVTHDLAAAHVDLLRQRDAHGLPGADFVRLRRVEALDRGDRRVFARRRELDRVADANPSRRDLPGEDAAVVAGGRELVNVLHRHPESTVLARRSARQTVESLEHRRPRVPRHLVARAGDVLSVERGNGDEMIARQVELLQERAVFVHDRVEPLLRVGDEIHLVDDHHDARNAEHAQERRVPARVLTHTLVRVDHEQRGLRARGPGDHVLQELDVAGRVDQDVFASLSPEETPRRVDRDALRLLVLQGVEEEGVLERLAGTLARGLHVLDLPGRNRPRIGEESSDDRALSVIDVTDERDRHALRERSGIGRIGYLRGRVAGEWLG